MDKKRSDTVAVLMSAYNESREWLENSIGSILNQTYENLVLYIVNDNPKNKNLSEVLDEFKKKDKRIIVVKNEDNYGLVKSLNIGLRLIKEDYVARMDADDFSKPNRLEIEMAFLRDNALDFVMSGMDIMTNDSDVIPGRVLPDLLPEKISEIQKYTNVSSHPTWLLKKEVYEKLHGYREVCYCEDVDFVLRAIQNGFRIGRVSENLICYRLDPRSVSHINSLEQRKKARFIIKEYRLNRSVEDIDTEHLNEMFDHYSNEEKKAYADILSNIDTATKLLYEKKLCSLAMFFLKETIRNPSFFREVYRAAKEKAIVSSIASKA